MTGLCCGTVRALRAEQRTLGALSAQRRGVSGAVRERSPSTGRAVRPLGVRRRTACRARHVQRGQDESHRRSVLRHATALCTSMGRASGAPTGLTSWRTGRVRRRRAVRTAARACAGGAPTGCSPARPGRASVCSSQLTRSVRRLVREMRVQRDVLRRVRRGGGAVPDGQRVPQ